MRRHLTNTRLKQNPSRVSILRCGKISSCQNKFDLRHCPEHSIDPRNKYNKKNIKIIRLGTTRDNEIALQKNFSFAEYCF